MNPRPIKKTEIAGIIGATRKYKIVKVNPDGTYTSVLAGQARSFSATPLRYETGRVTESVVFGSATSCTGHGKLIFVYDCITQANMDMKKLGTDAIKEADTRAILEVTPVGFSRPNRAKAGITLCEAVLVGKEVARHEPPKEVDVTSECKVTFQAGSYGGYYIQLEHGGLSIAEIGVNGVGNRFSTEGRYRLEDKGKGSNFRVYKTR